MEEVQKQKLRKGFTTGTCATASAKAAILSIIKQQKVEGVDVTLPKGNSIKIKIENCKFTEDSARDQQENSYQLLNL